MGASLSDAAGAHRRAIRPAGGADTIARLMGQWLSERLGQQFVVENRPGGGANIGTEAVVRASPDGYTLLIAGGYNAINATLYDKLNFNFIRDIAAVAGIVVYPDIMLVNPSVPAKSVPEFIAYAKGPGGWMQQSAVPRCAILSVGSTGRHRAVKRRDFITLVGGAAAAWPLAARAQQPGKIPRIGIIDNSPHWNAFRRGLRDLGYLEGQNIAFDYAYGDGAPERLTEAAAALVRRPVDVIAPSI